MAALQRCCRICAAEHDTGVMIFGSQGHERMLRDSIHKYLHVEISLEDRLPKMVCIKCCTQIDSIRIFAEMACETQISFRKQLETLDHVMKLEDTNITAKVSLCNADREHDASENDYKDDNSSYDDEPHVTEMEVRLDPMMFLDSHTDDSQTSDGKCFGEDMITITPEEECATLTKIGNQNQSLTIELVRLSERSGKPDYEKKGRALPDLKPIRPTKRFMPTDVIRPYVCTFCPRSFFSSIALQNHSWLHLNKEITENFTDGKLTCPICRKDISTKGNLKVHMETHRPKGKYNCDICGRVFKTQSNLYRHKEYHGGEVYTCAVCGRVYPTNSTLRAHSVTHSDARPHNCPLCKKTFKRNQDLKFHINQHTGARPYRCPYCPKAFASSGNCFSHRKRMHPMEVERDREKSAHLNSL